MVDPWAWVFWLWVVLMVYAVSFSGAKSVPTNKTIAICDKHPSTKFCACRKNLPPGKK